MMKGNPRDKTYRRIADIERHNTVGGSVLCTIEGTLLVMWADNVNELSSSVY
jgi:hypothetical protein